MCAVVGFFVCAQCMMYLCVCEGDGEGYCVGVRVCARSLITSLLVLSVKAHSEHSQASRVLFQPVTAYVVLSWR